MANRKAAACAAPSPAPKPSAISLPDEIAIAHHSIKYAARRLQALAAIEQLLRVPVPDDSKADSGSMCRVFRDDLAELLAVVNDALAEQIDFAAKHAKNGLEQVMGKSLPDL